MVSSPQDKTATTKRWLIAAVLLGVAARLAVTLVLTHRGVQYQDERQYWILAQRIRAGGGLSNPVNNMYGIVRGGEPTAMWGLLFPYFLAGCQALFGERLLVVRLVVGQLSWLGLCLAMLGYTRRRWSDWQRTALVGIMAVHPNLVFLDSYLMTESLFIPLAAAVVWMGAAWRWRAVRGDPGRGRSLLWGAAYGLLHLVRMNLAPFQLLQAGAGVWRRPTRNVLRGAALSLLGTAVMLAPWLYRNHLRYGVWTLETKSGFNLLLMNDLVQKPSPGALAGANDAQRNAAYGRIAVAWIENHPAAFARNCGRRLLAGWALAPVVIRIHPPWRTGVQLYYALLYGLMLLGMAVSWRRWGDAAGLIVYATVLMTFTNAAFRHRSYAEPFILLLIVEGAWWLGTRMRLSGSRAARHGVTRAENAENAVPDGQALQQTAAPLALRLGPDGGLGPGRA